MLIASISEFRKDIKAYFDKVSTDFETLIINRGKNEGIVVMSLEEYNSLMATNHELSSRKNEMRLDAAIEKMKKGDKTVRTLIDL
ncbi:type II toxin-antitoxin system prevent-host-death family antitoxin [Myroides sp. M-43]|uniref:type II toxin-antitoxin system Phd/YefM family antitoxin n=1 Tax=Myroides oncorhynchi TaxID=2893756 RepID=UPI001E3F75CA|nr:type II toxin-antitoxin system prevent-host-death family antitoxin [Myroides oncorhynchi]MCC9042995.1 type II toxin-antitoxin system prevent-host-death family antitoxin [Myroides oncorhynchi]